jgi:SAM-dependent methyltransferase
MVPETLRDQIRDDAATRRATAGPSRVPPLEDPRVALEAAVGPTGRRLAGHADAGDLHDLADPAAADLRSHRPVVGIAVRAAKRALLGLLEAVLRRQQGFNLVALDAVAALDRGGANARRILEARLDALEANASRFGGRLSPAIAAFDYDAFERVFRGDPARLRSSLERYCERLEESAAAPVLDLGCGRGEFLEMLRERGIPAYGIDRDPFAVAAARSRGLDVREGDLLSGLRAWPEGSLGAIVAFQVIEHLSLMEVRELLAVSRERLRPGGTLVLETVNVSSPFALAHGWSIDPTHRLRLHARVLRALAEAAGFWGVELRATGSVEPEAVLENDGALRDRGHDPLGWIFAPQDCALVARR